MTYVTVYEATDDAATVLGESRSRVLAVLQDAGEPLTVDLVAERVRLHPNTARFHLDGLVTSGHAEREAEERDRPGRPRMLYAAAADSTRAGPRSYQLLAEILTNYLASEVPNPGTSAQRAGHAWGKYLAQRPRPSRRVDSAAAIKQLTSMLDELGFDPEATTTGRSRQVLLHHCPFREAAAEHQEVICSVHLGLMRGMLDELGAPIEAKRLEPFAGPSLCVTDLGRRSSGTRAKARTGKAQASNTRR